MQCVSPRAPVRAKLVGCVWDWRYCSGFSAGLVRDLNVSLFRSLTSQKSEVNENIGDGAKTIDYEHLMFFTLFEVILPFLLTLMDTFQVHLQVPRGPLTIASKLTV